MRISIVVVALVVGIICLSWNVGGSRSEKLKLNVTEVRTDIASDSILSNDVQKSQSTHRVNSSLYNETGSIQSYKYFQGTDVPDGLITDTNGNLVVTVKLRNLIDYYFTMLGSKDQSEIEALLESYILSHSEEPARSQALSIFRNYLLLQKQISQFSSPGVRGLEDVSMLMSFLEGRNGLRYDYLGEEVAEAFYGDENTYDQYTVSRLRVTQNTSLSQQEKAEALDSLLMELPPSMRDPIQKRQLVTALREQAVEAKHNGLTADELFVEREALVGYETASRFRKLDRSRELWSERYSDYRAQLLELEESNLSELDRQSAVDDLQKQHFKNSELKRVASLDRNSVH